MAHVLKCYCSFRFLTITINKLLIIYLQCSVTKKEIILFREFSQNDMESFIGY